MIFKNLISKLPRKAFYLRSPSCSSVCGPRWCSSNTLQLPADIKFEELQNKLKTKDIVLIDVRSAEEWEMNGYIAGSINLNLVQLGQLILLRPEDFERHVGFKKPQLDEPLAMMCLAGIRARTAQLAMIGAGFKNVRCYEGSFKDWLENDGPIQHT